jgi:hypothetical protein
VHNAAKVAVFLEHPIQCFMFEGIDMLDACAIIGTQNNFLRQERASAAQE